MLEATVTMWQLQKPFQKSTKFPWATVLKKYIHTQKKKTTYALELTKDATPRDPVKIFAEGI